MTFRSNRIIREIAIGAFEFSGLALLILMFVAYWVILP
jgi:hypothetical protein